MGTLMVNGTIDLKEIIKLGPFNLPSRPKLSPKTKIEIKDDGIGFDEMKIEEGLGIQNVKHRMRISKLKGLFESEPGKGTKIKLILDLKK